MNSLKLKLALCAVCVFLSVPSSSEAAVSAIAVTDNAAIFAIKFDFIAGKETYKVPIGAMRGLAFGSESNFVGFDIAATNETVNSQVVASGLVLSTQPIVDGLYYEIEPGERASFTFVAVANVPETTPTGQYQAVMTHIPHFVGDKRVEVLESRLGQFESDTVILNKIISSATFTLTSK